MAQASQATEALPIKYDTAIAVLQTEFKNINEKLDRHATETYRLLREFQVENAKQHGELASRIDKLERWRFMLIGAGIVFGGLGYSGIEKLLGMH